MALNDYINTLTAANIPFESHCGHRPIVLASNRCEATEEKNLQDVDSGANLLRQAKKRFVPHISPYVCTLEFYSVCCLRCNPLINGVCRGFGRGGPISFKFRKCMEINRNFRTHSRENGVSLPRPSTKYRGS